MTICLPKSARAGIILFAEQYVLCIHRIKPDRSYWVLPGGTQEEGETVLQTAQREIKEELDLAFPDWDVPCIHLDNDGRSETYFVLRVPKRLDISIHGEEKERMAQDNQYHLEEEHSDSLLFLHETYAFNKELLIT